MTDLATEDDPYALPTDRAFFADAVADRIEDRGVSDPIVIKGGISPSGIPHLGNANELVIGQFVADALRDRGHEVRQVFTTDDRDPLRTLPRKLANLDGEIVDLDAVDAGALGRNLGVPYTDIPDPFGCCDSYGDHFSQLIADMADQLGVDLEIVSTTELYESGAFEDTIRDLLEDRDRARDVLAEYQAGVDENYVPFNPICEECGIVTEAVTDVNPGAGSVEYLCDDIEAGDREIAGCGYEGTAGMTDGKLPWRFEWVAQWAELGVDFEPFGKDHAEGSWPSGVDIARNVMGVEPPVPMVYEWFTLDGEPFSSSSGHVITVQEALELVERPVLRYFFAKDPTSARDFSIEHIDDLVAEFDRLEGIYYGEIPADEDEEAYADRVYPFLVDSVADTRPVRIPFSFAAVLGMTDDPALREEIARREGHITDDDSQAAIDRALARVERAREWAARTDNAYNYELKRGERPDVDIDENTAAGLDELADLVESTDDPEAIQSEIYEIARRHDVEVGEFFGTGYQLFFGQADGPRLGPFLAKLDKQFVVSRLRREG